MKYRKIMTAIASMTMAGVMLAGCSSNSTSGTSGTSSTDSGSAAGTAQLLQAAANPPPAARRLASRYGVRRRIRN